ncbi:MAG: DUF108 domain-containing protein [Candidatus Omnitrophica bacterium]|nr:DUF108 domain-containing protein [Candidatus Omnitrophota bacterium]
MMRCVGIVGCGAIGSALADAIERDYAKIARVVALADRDRQPAFSLQQRLSNHPPIVSVGELIRRSHVVIEAAAGAVAARVARLALAQDKDVLVMSTGGLLTGRAGWRRAAATSGGRLYVPSGALCGLDGVKAMALGTIRRIRLTTSKPPRALASSAFVRSQRVRLDRLRRATVVFEGSPSDAVKAFPQNTNVAATVALACRGPHRSRRSRAPVPTVRVIADPALRVNVHELEVEGDCGRLSVRVENRPSSMNPKTSELAIRSALVTLRQVFESVRIGT